MGEPPVIEYASAPDRRGYRPPKWALLAWPGISFLLWLVLDWGVYVERGPERWRKFTLPLWFQLSVSVVLGTISVIALLVIVATVRRFRGSR
jgi:hypothetical protein